MPLYEYCCQKCGAQFEMLVSLSSDKKPACESCGSEDLKKLISKPAATGKDCGSCSASSCSGCSGCG